MDITTLQEYVTTNADDEDGEVGLRLLVAKLGQLAEVSIGLDDGGFDDDERSEAMRDMLAGIMVIVAHAAMEEDVDLDDAVRERVDGMREKHEKRDEMEEAMENLDFEKIADELGLLDDDDEDEAAEIEEGITADTDEKRMFY